MGQPVRVRVPLPLPVIAAVNGLALGAGCEHVLPPAPWRPSSSPARQASISPAGRAGLELEVSLSNRPTALRDAQGLRAFVGKRAPTFGTTRTAPPTPPA